jgi:hypothetical protein
MCELYNDNCRYDKPPPMSQLLAMAQRLQEAERNVSELRAIVEQGSSGTECAQSQAPSSAGTPQRASARSASPGIHPTPSANVATQSEHLVESSAVISGMGSVWDDGSTAALNEISHLTPKEGAAPELTPDEHGNIRYYGPTSAVHEPVQVDSPTFPRSNTGPSAVSANPKRALAAHALESSIWEDFALGNASLHTGIPRQTIARLLNIHWTWVSPMFLWIHRSAFMRTSTCTALEALR